MIHKRADLFRWLWTRLKI